jgi:ABC-type transport system involved in multi-copper enzyme maturation permease subunit
MFNIAINTFREIVRNKFLYLILFFAFVFIVFSILLGDLSLWNDKKLIVDFGLSMIEIFWILWVIFIWSQLLFNEVEGKTIFLILSKPIKRYEFILWKFFGFSGTIFLIVFLQAMVFLGVLYFKDIEITKFILMSLFFTFLKLEILLSIVLFFSSFTSNIITILVSIWVYLASNSFSLLLDLAHHSKNTIILYSSKALNLLFPPLEHLNTKDLIGTFDFSALKWISLTNYFLANTFYASAYLVLILFFTVLIFKRKTFEN